jgi:ATPase family associated with various cellular activities (AAA)
VTDWPTPLALLPRSDGARPTRDGAMLLLESERTIAAGLAIRAIAEAWDSGRLGSAEADEELPREREVLGLLGVTSGLAAERLKEASESLRDVMDRHAQLEKEVPGLHPLQELRAELSISELGRTLLMLIVAPQMWGEIAQLYGVVANNPTRAICDEHLLKTLLKPFVNPHQLAYELDPRQPLRRFGLVRTTSAEPRPFTGLAPDPLVLARLRGESLASDPAGELTVLPPGKPIASLRIPDPIAETIKRAIGRRPIRPLRIVVRGRDGSGRRTLISSLAALARRRVAMVNLHHVGDARAMAEVSRALERCVLAGWIPCIDGLESVAADDRPLRERLRRVLGEFPGPMGLRLETGAQPPIDPGYLLVDIPDLSEGERIEVWRTELTQKGISVGDTLGPLTSRWRIGPGTIHRVVEHVTEGGNTQITSQQIDAAVSQHLERKLGDVAEKIRHLPRLADMVLPPDIMDSMTEFLARMKMHRQVFEDWGMTKVASTGRGITALFQGPPGTGKTMVAGALARELGIELYRVDLSRVMSKWIGETERNLGNVFSAAEESQAIILFDEADSLFGKRTEVKSSNDRFANLEVNYLLQRLDTFFGIAILTTNLGTSIDPAFKRRLSFRVHFPVPDEEQREQLWRVHLPPSLPAISTSRSSPRSTR